MTHSKLSAQPNELWDRLFDQAKRMAVTTGMGFGIGMNHHLLVDGLLQPALYHDLPLSMPIEAHQPLFVVSGVGEAIDTGKKGRGNMVMRETHVDIFPSQNQVALASDSHSRISEIPSFFAVDHHRAGTQESNVMPLSCINRRIECLRPPVKWILARPLHRRGVPK